MNYSGRNGKNHCMHLPLGRLLSSGSIVPDAEVGRALSGMPSSSPAVIPLRTDTSGTVSAFRRFMQWPLIVNLGLFSFCGKVHQNAERKEQLHENQNTQSRQKAARSILFVG